MKTIIRYKKIVKRTQKLKSNEFVYIRIKYSVLKYLYSKNHNKMMKYPIKSQH